jgi:hypothetical protein
MTQFADLEPRLNPVRTKAVRNDLTAILEKAK